MKKIDIVLFTMNRACQADLALRSIKDMFKNVGKVVVFYKHTSDEFIQGYNKLFEKNYGLDIEKEYQTNFEEDFKRIIKNLKSPWYMGFCDDDVFIKETQCNDILLKLNEEDVSSISLKCHINETYHYPGYNAPLPEFIETKPYLKWAWRKYYRNDSDFGYPTNVNAMIYPRDYFIYLIDKIHFKCPNSMEGGLNTIRPLFKNYIYSFREPRVLNIVVNTVQKVCVINPNAPKYSFTPEELNKKFLEGQIILTKNLYGREVIATSEEVEYQFEKE